MKVYKIPEHAKKSIVTQSRLVVAERWKWGREGEEEGAEETLGSAGYAYAYYLIVVIISQVHSSSNLSNLTF